MPASAASRPEEVHEHDPRDERARIGDRLPDIVLPRLDGGMLHLGEYRGQRLLVFMWASW